MLFELDLRLTGTELSEQIANPSHVYIQTSKGAYICHSITEFDEGKQHPIIVKGAPMRFTALAAKRRIVLGGSLYHNTKLIPIE